MNLPFGGLNHIDISNLIYYPLEKASSLQLNKKLDDAAVKDVQFITFCRQFLKDVQTEKK